MPSLGSHKEKIRDVCTRNKQNDSDRTQENPEEAADVPDHVLDQWTNVWLQPKCLITWNMLHDGDHARNVGIGSSERDAWPQAAQCLETERYASYAGAIELHGEQHRGVRAKELKGRGQHAYNVNGSTIDHERLTKGVVRSAEPSLPVAVGQDHASRTARRVVFVSKEPAKEGRNS